MSDVYHAGSINNFTQNNNESTNSHSYISLDGSHMDILRDPRAQIYCSGQRRGFRGESSNSIDAGSIQEFTPGFNSKENEREQDEEFKRKAVIEQERKRPLLFTRKSHTGVCRGNKRAKFKAYERLDIRIQSFLGWKSECTRSVWIFARTGFFYKGFSDIAACFQCGLIHKHWKQDDDPIIVHLQLKPECQYIEDLVSDGFRSCDDLTEEVGDNDAEITEVATGAQNMSLSSDPHTNQLLLCKVCLVNNLEITIQPCCHLATCESCYRRLRKENMPCPICRGPIKDALRTYIPQ